MINITLPDGSKRRYEKPQSGLEIAQSISKSLSKEALVIKVNGTIQDLHLIIDKDSEIQIITHNSLEGLEIIRHDAAHVMAEACLL